MCKSDGTDDAGYGNATNAEENNSQNQCGILFPVQEYLFHTYKLLKAIGKYIVELDMGKIMKIKMKIILLVGSFIILCLSSYCICARIKNFQKLKTREQTKNLWQEGEKPNYEKGKKSEDRVYEGYWELPFSEMVYAQENTVEMLLNEYKDISFEYRFPVGECKYKNYFLGL